MTNLFSYVVLEIMRTNSINFLLKQVHVLRQSSTSVMSPLTSCTYVPKMQVRIPSEP